MLFNLTPLPLLQETLYCFDLWIDTHEQVLVLHDVTTTYHLYLAIIAQNS